ncbi:tripartite tricarboxylate transporter substrate binding protein [Hydrogenophaga sp. BPS33]|uniref:tripartite tricarboxylate transporter substrate binding protein n=1 Tax=Hydrogenophaga sp. BPS33 TaxID=2651974 RepID=UPI00131FA70C|nr:tripartite tricarboxylate transporter substrate binding protein [Hydrogenophaga sp. BPS33]QHE87639.1 tripartite tricarboxylate transporter substrate binding protein [Hydrogenophaga sp. BPS33]
MNRVRLAIFLALLGLAAASSQAATPAPYPSKPVTLIVPFPAGGSADVIARVINVPLGNQLGQPVVVENVGGAGGGLGAARLARAPADGYTVLLGTVNEVVVVPLVNRTVPYKVDDLVPVGKVGESSLVLVGRKDIPARNTDELVEYARSNPGKLTYATSGIGSMQHVIMEMVQARTGASMLHVPYRGGSSLISDVLGGQVDLAIVTPAAAADHIEAGRLRAFGTTSLRRDESLKRVPTLNEGQYLKDLQQNVWIGLFVPVNTPSDVATRLNAALTALLADEGVRSQLQRASLSPAARAEQAGFSAKVAEDRAQMRETVSKMKLSKD